MRELVSRSHLNVDIGSVEVKIVKARRRRERVKEARPKSAKPLFDWIKLADWTEQDETVRAYLN